MSKKNLGIIFMILFALSYSAMQCFISLTDVGVMQQIFVRNFMNMVVVLFLILKKGGSLFGAKKYQPWLFARDIFSFMGITCLFCASRFNGNQADITILNKMSPFFITIFASIFLKEKLSKIQIPALILAFTGAFFAAKPTYNADSLPLILAFLSAITTGVSYTMLSYFKDKVDGLAVILHFSTFCVVASLPFMLYDFQLPTGMKLVTLLLVGVFGTLGQLFVTYAYRLAPASEISIYNYSGILFSVIMGHFVLGQSVGLNSIIGGVIVTIASVMVYMYNRSRVGA